MKNTRKRVIISSKTFHQMVLKVSKWFSPGVGLHKFVSHSQDLGAFLPNNHKIVQLVYDTGQLDGITLVHKNFLWLGHKFGISFDNCLFVTTGIKYLIAFISVAVVIIITIILFIIVVVIGIVLNCITNWRT